MITRVNPYQRDLVESHVSPLCNTEEMLLSKFEYVPEEHEIQRYVTGINFERDYVIGDVNSDLGKDTLSGLGHMIIRGHEAELSLTYLPGCQDSAPQILLVALNLLETYWEGGNPKTLYVAKSNWPIVRSAFKALKISLPTREMIGDGFPSVARCYKGKRELIAINCNDLSCVSE